MGEAGLSGGVESERQILSGLRKRNTRRFQVLREKLRQAYYSFHIVGRGRDRCDMPPLTGPGYEENHFIKRAVPGDRSGIYR